MNIRIATEEDRQLWDSYVWKHPHGVAYHQFAWGQSVKNAYRFDPVYLIAKDQGQITGVLPMVRMKIPFRGSQLVSLPYCDLGGVLADDESVASDLCDYALNLAKCSRDKELELRQSTGGDVPTQTNKARMLLRLPETSDELMAGFKAKLRSQVKKPIRDGLMSELGGLELLEDFYRIMAINMRDLGSPTHSLRWFKEIVSQYGENVRIGIVRTPDDKPIGGGIVLLHRKTISIPWASTLREYNRFNPNMLLYWTFLAFAVDKKYEFFDFGRSTLERGRIVSKSNGGHIPFN